jgi:NADH-quinone oxidoreductase subunit N
MLLAFLAHTANSLSALLYYVATYALTTLGVFAILQVLDPPHSSRHPERSEGPLYLSLSSPISPDRIADLAGLSRRSPLLAACLAIFLLSLAGIPPLSGFFAKFYLFTAVLAANPGSHLLLTLIALAIAMSAVSLYYYLRVLKSAFIAEAPEDLPPIHTPFLTTFTIALIALAVILLGCAPNLFVHWITSAANTLI